MFNLRFNSDGVLMVKLDAKDYRKSSSNQEKWAKKINESFRVKTGKTYVPYIFQGFWNTFAP